QIISAANRPGSLGGPGELGASGIAQRQWPDRIHSASSCEQEKRGEDRGGRSTKSERSRVAESEGEPKQLDDCGHPAKPAPVRAKAARAGDAVAGTRVALRHTGDIFNQVVPLRKKSPP